MSIFLLFLVCLGCMCLLFLFYFLVCCLFVIGGFLFGFLGGGMAGVWGFCNYL